MSSRISRGHTRSLGFDRYSGFYFWALFIIIFSIWTPHLFLTRSTLYSVADSQAVSAILGVAVVIPMAAGAFDLSVGAMIGLSAIVATWLQDSHHWNVWVAILVAIVVSIILGAINGFIVVKWQVSSFITTLGMATVIGALQEIISGSNQPLPPTSHAWNQLTQAKVGGIQIVVLYMLVIALFFWWVMTKTPPGRYLYATGGNSEASRLSGVRVGKWTWLALITSGGLAGVAGVLYASQNGPSLTFGPSLLLPAFAAAFLGSTQLTPGRVNVWGTVLAVYVLATGVKGLELITGAQWLNDMFNGLALIFAVAFALWSQRRAGRSRTSRRGASELDEEEVSPASADLSTRAEEFARESAANE